MVWIKTQFNSLASDLIVASIHTQSAQWLLGVDSAVIHFAKKDQIHGSVSLSKHLSGMYTLVLVFEMINSASVE